MPFPRLLSRLKHFLRRKFKTKMSLASVQEVPGNVAKAIDVQSVKVDLEISYGEEIQEKDIPDTRASPPPPLPPAK